jgi:hypothetical protein
MSSAKESFHEIEDPFEARYRALTAQYDQILKGEGGSEDEEKVVRKLSEVIYFGSYATGSLLPETRDLLSDRIIGHVALHQAKLFLDRYFRASHPDCKHDLFLQALKWIELHLHMSKLTITTQNLWFRLITFENWSEIPRDSIAPNIGKKLSNKESLPFDRALSLSPSFTRRLQAIMSIFAIPARDILIILKDILRYHYLGMNKTEFSRALRNECSDQSNEIVLEVFELFFQLPLHLLEEDQQYVFFEEVELLLRYFSKPIFTLAEVKEVITKLRKLLP